MRAFTPVFDGLWRNPGTPFPHYATAPCGLQSFPPACRNPARSIDTAQAGRLAPPFVQAKEITMKYLLLIYGNESAMLSASQETVGQMMAAYGAYTEAVKKAGILVGSNRLRPTASGTTVRVANGKTEVLDGPYAETKEQLGGYYMIDVPDLDAALSWAARCPGASHGTIEVRPIWEM
jgi:hypothetical protein